MYENNTLLSHAEAKVLAIFLDLNKHYFAEIVKKTKITRPRTLRALRSLAKCGILTISKEANVKYYLLAKIQNTYAILSLIEYNKSSNFLEKNKTLKRALEMLAKTYKDYLVLAIFGSYAKGYAAKNSDVDLLMIKESFSNREIKNIEDIIDIINGRTGLKISPYLMKLGELKIKNKLVKEVIENHILISGGELFFKVILE